MREKLLVITLCSMLFGLIFPIAQTSASESKNSGTNKIILPENTVGKSSGRFALLIGINDYEDASINKLNGCENDVTMINDLLTAQYGFQKNSDVQTLLSKNATRKAILDNFRKQLIDNAKAFYEENKLDKNKRNQGATVVFYYSGHGATLPDYLDEKKEKLSGEESDGLDETIVPYDSKLDGTNAIIDDEFDGLYNELNKWTTNVVFIFDSCHSGTATRATENVRRTDFKYKLPEKLKAEMNSRNVGDENLTDGMDDMDRGETDGVGYVTLSGCLPNQLSQEKQLPDETGKPKANGLLTYYLVKQLRINPTGSYREIMQTVQNAVRLQNPFQIPQFEGDIDQPVFNIKTGNAVNKLLPKQIAFTKGENMTVKLEAGKVVGALEGGIIAIYSKDARSLSGDNERIGSGTIETADDFTSTAKITLTDKSKEVPADARIALVTPYFGSAKRLIALDTSSQNAKGGSADVMQEVKKITDKENFVKTVEIANPLGIESSKRNWDAAIVRMSYDEFKVGNKQAAVKSSTAPKDDEQIYALTDKIGMPLYNFYVLASDENAAKKISDALEKHVRVENIRAFGNGTGGMNDKLKLEIVPVAAQFDKTKKTCDIKETPDSQRINKDKVEILNPGQQFYFKISNNTEKDLFIYLYDIAPDGAIKLLYPDQKKNVEESLEQGIKIKTHGTDQCYIFRFSLPKESPDSKRGTVAPYGVETFKLIATEEKINGRVLESSAIARTRQTDSSPLENLLEQASINETRSGVRNNVKFSGWATTSLNVEVREK